MKPKPMSLSAKIGSVIVAIVIALGFTAIAFALAGCQASHVKVVTNDPPPEWSRLYPSATARFAPLEGGRMWIETDADH